MIPVAEKQHFVASLFGGVPVGILAQGCFAGVLRGGVAADLEVEIDMYPWYIYLHLLGVGFKDFLFSPLFGEDSHFD